MKKLLFITFLFLSQWLNAQTLITGSVTDDKGEPLPGANVFIQNTYDGASSDTSGVFQFKTREEGSHFLIAEFMGYEAQLKEIQLNGSPVKQQFSLKEKFNELNAVVITAGSFEAGDKKRAIELSAIDVATTSGAMGDIVGAINTLPGTTPVGESGRLYVRGGSDQETKTFIDGLLVSKPYHASAPNLSTRGRFNPFLFNGVIFNTGGYSAEYGQALSSVLLLNTIDEKQKDELNISLLLGLGADIAGTKSWDGGSVTASGNYFTMKGYAKLLSLNQDWENPGEFFSQETSFKQKTGKYGMLKAYYNINQNRFSILQNDLDNKGEQLAIGQKTNNYFFNTSWQNSLSEKWNVYTGISATLNKDNIEIDQNPLEEKLNSGHFKAGLDYQLTEKVNFRFGTDYFLNDYTFTYSPDSTSFKNQFNNNLIANYLEANIYTSNKLVLRAGVRSEYSILLGKNNYAPRFSSAYKIDEHSQLSLAYGQFYQNPSYQDLSWNKELDFERADHYILNYQKNANKRIFRTEVYYKNYENLVKYDENNNQERSNYSNDGDGYAYGVDVFLKDAQSIYNGQFWISYSYLQTKRNYQNFPQEAIPQFASDHNVSIVYKHFISSWRSMLSADYSYSSPRYYHNPNREGFQNAQMRSYQSLNVSLSYLYRNQIIFYGAVNNVMGRKNEFGYRYANNPDSNGRYASEVIAPFSKRFFVVGVFFTFSKDKTKNQLDKIN